MPLKPVNFVPETASKTPRENKFYTAVPPPKSLTTRTSEFTNNVTFNRLGQTQLRLPEQFTSYVQDGKEFELNEIAPGHFAHSPGITTAHPDRFDTEFRGGRKFVRHPSPSFPAGSTPGRNPVFERGNPIKYLGTDLDQYVREHPTEITRAHDILSEHTLERAPREQSIFRRNLGTTIRSTRGETRTVLEAKPFTAEANELVAADASALSTQQTFAFGAASAASATTTAIANYYKTYARISPTSGGGGEFSPDATRADQIEANDRQQQLAANAQNQKTERTSGWVQAGITVAELALLFL